MKEVKKTITQQSDLERKIGIAMCAFMVGVIVCFGALVQIGAL